MSLMLRAFKTFCPAVQAAMENSGDSLKIWDMYDMKTLPKWCEGSSAIIGDAAHPFQPCETLQTMVRVQNAKLT